jgi:tetratricopeptide (TPR) repeat protein
MELRFTKLLNKKNDMKFIQLLLIFSVFNVQVATSQSGIQDKTKEYENLADTLYKYFKYDSASLYYSKAAKLYEQNQQWLQCVKNYRLTSDALVQTAKYDTAFYYSKRALDLEDKLFQESNKDEMLEYFDALLNMANIAEKQGKYKVELLYIKKALETTLKTDSLSRLKIAEVWNRLGIAYYYLGRNDSAFSYCQNALNTRINLLGGGYSSS